MNEKKICFILCSNYQLYEDECKYYINKLEVPEGYDIEILVIKDADSMTSGYNKGMLKTEAKFKIYLHQDVFIVNNRFLFEILRLFEDKSIGMIGMVGTIEIPEDTAVWLGKRVGMIHSNSIFFANSYVFGMIEGVFEAVEAVDGLMIITQYDLPWREDIFKGWDYYDISQSMEFRKKGYKVIVPRTEKPWCIHDDGFLDLRKYNDNREKYFSEYGKKWKEGI